MDPTGYLFGSLFKAIGKLFSKLFNAVVSLFKAVLNIPLLRSVIQIAACAVGGIVGCIAAAGAMTLAAGGSIGDALMAMAFSAVQIGTWTAVGMLIEPLQAAMSVAGDAFNIGFAMAKGAIHGIVGGALSVMQGGDFVAGFVSNALGAAAGVFSQGIFGAFGTGDFGAMMGRTMMAAAAGCGGAVLSGGKCANGAVTAAMAHLFNAEGKLFKCLALSTAACGAGAVVGAKLGGPTACGAGGPTCPVTGPAGAAAGAALGCGVSSAAALAMCLQGKPGTATTSTATQNKSCPPCRLVDGTVVPKGTISYRWDSPRRPQHGIVGDHLNLYIANQNPYNCRCFWQKSITVAPPPRPEWIPIQPFQ